MKQMRDKLQNANGNPTMQWSKMSNKNTT